MYKNVINKLWQFGVRPSHLHYQSIYSASLLFQNQRLWHFRIFHRPLKSAEELESLSIKHSSACLLHSANAALFAFLKPHSFLFLLCFRFVLLIGDIHLQSDTPHVVLKGCLEFLVVRQLYCKAWRKSTCHKLHPAMCLHCQQWVRC